MAEISLTELFAVLADWWEDESRLVGLEETQELEFKARSYNLASSSEKLEFAKDVSAMANSGGGVILLGVQTSRDEAIGRDVSTAVTPVVPGSVDADQMASVARDWIYPPQRDLEVREWRRPEDNMIVSVRVPPLRDHGGLALIRGADLDGQPRRNLLGIAARHGDRVDHFNPDEVYHWIRLGRRLSGVSPTHIEAEPAGPSPEEEAYAEAEAIQELFADSEWPVFVLQAWPSANVRLQGIHDQTGIRGALESREPLRPRGGFNLRWLQQAEVYRDGGLSISLGTREGLRVIPAGVVTMFGDGGPNLLGWGMEKHGEQPMVNPTALAELTYEFVSLVTEAAVSAMQPQPEALIYRLVFFNAHQPAPLTLQAGFPQMFNMNQPQPAPDDQLECRIEVDATAAPELVVGLLLRDVYGRFGLGVEAIPFIEEGEFRAARLVELAGPGL